MSVTSDGNHSSRNWSVVDCSNSSRNKSVAECSHYASNWSIVDCSAEIWSFSCERCTTLLPQFYSHGIKTMHLLYCVRRSKNGEQRPLIRAIGKSEWLLMPCSLEAPSPICHLEDSIHLEDNVIPYYQMIILTDYSYL